MKKADESGRVFVGKTYITNAIENKTARGGKRPGAGRKATGRKPNRTFRLNDDEFEKVKKFIEDLRKG